MKFTILASLISLFACQADAVITRDDFSPAKSAKWGKKFPAVCYVGTSFEDGSGLEGTGVLIAPDKILTTAHNVRSNRDVATCNYLFAPNPKNPTGESILGVGDVTHIDIHPDSNLEIIRGREIVTGPNLAILTLDQPLTTVAPVCLPEEPLAFSDEDMACGKRAYFVGHGQGGTNTSGALTVAGIRRAGMVRVIPSADETEYQEVYYPPEGVNPRSMPDKFQIDADTDTYQCMPTAGDAGGALLVGPKDSPVLAGIYTMTESAAMDEADAFIYRVRYASTHTHLAWIQQVLDNSVDQMADDHH